MGYEIDFIRPGDSSGDSICIRYDTDPGHFRVHVVDGGFIDTGDRIIEHLERYYRPRAAGNLVINHMVLSHADNDHAGGLIRVLEKYEVGTLWMNRPWLFADLVKDDFHGNYSLQGLIDDIREMNAQSVALEEVAIRKGTRINSAFQGTQIGSFTVLAPKLERYIASIPSMGRTPQSYAADAAPRGFFRSMQDLAATIGESLSIETLKENPGPTSASNESSIVQLGLLDGDKRILLTADAGPIALHEAADYATATGLMGPLSFVQVPHHGSRHNVTPSVLDRWLGPRVIDTSEKRGRAYVSVGSNASEYPRRSVSNAFRRRGYPVFSTRTTSMISHFNGIGHSGLVPIDPVPFFSEVEA